MLEHPCLIVHAWTRADDGSAWIRRVTDASGTPLGYVRASTARPWWLRWLLPLRLDVYETDDASHLMTLTRSWGLSRIWHVHDADDIHVGGLYLKTLVTSERTWLGTLTHDSPAHGTITDPRRSLLARYERRPDKAWDLTLAMETMTNPFVRMLILGVILSLDPTP